MKNHDHNKISESDPYQPDNVPLKELLMRLFDNQAFIKQKYGEELFLIIQKQHEELIEKIRQHQKIATRIVAKKASH